MGQPRSVEGPEAASTNTLAPGSPGRKDRRGGQTPVEALTTLTLFCITFTYVLKIDAPPRGTGSPTAVSTPGEEQP